jgi:hypothetical protein
MYLGVLIGFPKRKSLLKKLTKLGGQFFVTFFKPVVCVSAAYVSLYSELILECWTFTDRVLY